jgi:hypothetical protein
VFLFFHFTRTIPSCECLEQDDGHYGFPARKPEMFFFLIWTVSLRRYSTLFGLPFFLRQPRCSTPAEKLLLGRVKAGSGKGAKGLRSARRREFLFSDSDCTDVNRTLSASARWSAVTRFRMTAIQSFQMSERDEEPSANALSSA